MPSREERLAAIKTRIAVLEKQRTNDVDKFNRIMRELVELKGQEALLLTKKTVIDGFERIMTRTPVDTGRALASWQFDVDKDPKGEVPPGDYKGNMSQHIQEETDKVRTAPPGVWYFANHLNYIEALEAGWSKQQPAGMVGLTLREMQRELEAAARKFEE